MTVKLSNTPVGVTPKRTDIEFEGVKVAEINAGGIKGDGVSFDPAGTGLASTNMQDGLAEIVPKDSVRLSLTGTEVDYTFPVSFRRLRVRFYDMSTNGTSQVIIQLGTSSGLVTTGYRSVAGRINTGSSGVSASEAGLSVAALTNIGNSCSGLITLEKHTGTGDFWVASGSLILWTDFGVCYNAGRSSDLGAVLDRIRITTAGGTDNFDAGTVSLSWEV